MNQKSIATGEYISHNTTVKGHEITDAQLLMRIFYSLHLHACSGEGKDLMRMGLALAVLTLPHTLHLKEH